MGANPNSGPGPDLPRPRERRLAGVIRRRRSPRSGDRVERGRVVLQVRDVGDAVEPLQPRARDEARRLLVDGLDVLASRRPTRIRVGTAISPSRGQASGVPPWSPGSSARSGMSFMAQEQLAHLAADATLLGASGRRATSTPRAARPRRCRRPPPRAPSSSSSSWVGPLVSSGYGAPRIADPMSASAPTRSGWASVRSIAVRPPIEQATTTGRANPAASSTASASASRRPAVLALVGRLPEPAHVVGEAPVRGLSRSTTCRQLRRSFTPAWMRRTSGPSSGPLMS